MPTYLIVHSTPGHPGAEAFSEPPRLRMGDDTCPLDWGDITLEVPAGSNTVELSALGASGPVRAAIALDLPENSGTRVTFVAGSPDGIVVNGQWPADAAMAYYAARDGRVLERVCTETDQAQGAGAASAPIEPMPSRPAVGPEIGATGSVPSATSPDAHSEFGRVQAAVVEPAERIDGPRVVSQSTESRTRQQPPFDTSAAGGEQPAPPAEASTSHTGEFGQTADAAVADWAPEPEVTGSAFGETVAAEADHEAAAASEPAAAGPAAAEQHMTAGSAPAERFAPQPQTESADGIPNAVEHQDAGAPDADGAGVSETTAAHHERFAPQQGPTAVPTTLGGQGGAGQPTPQQSEAPAWQQAPAATHPAGGADNRWQRPAQQQPDAAHQQGQQSQPATPQQQGYDQQPDMYGRQGGESSVPTPQQFDAYARSTHQQQAQQQGWHGQQPANQHQQHGWGMQQSGHQAQQQGWGHAQPQRPQSAPAPHPQRPPQAGWYPDPNRRAEYRWFDGNVWTGYVATGGVQSYE